MHPYSVLIRPILSEKSNKLRENSAKYVFSVRRDADKDDIARAVERMYDVKVLDVQTLVKRGKIRRRGNHLFQSSSEKRAFITLAKGTKIPVFEDQ